MLLAQGENISAIQRATGLNRATIRRIRDQPSEGEDWSAMGGDTLPPFERFRLWVMHTVVQSALAYWMRHDPRHITRWADHIFLLLFPVPDDQSDGVMRQVALDDPDFRRKWADLGLSREEGRTRGSQPAGKTRPARAGDNTSFGDLARTVRDRDKANERERLAVIDALGKAAGPGGVLSVVAQGLGPRHGASETEDRSVAQQDQPQAPALGGTLEGNNGEPGSSTKATEGPHDVLPQNDTTTEEHSSE